MAPSPGCRSARWPTRSGPSDGKLEIASKATLDKALGRSDDDAVKDHKSKHVTEEHNDFHHAGLEQLLNQEVAKTEDVNKADQQKAYEQRQNVLDQIIKHVEVRNFQNQTEMNLRLNPEYLGELKINMQHTKDGGVTTTIQTSSRVTRKLLEEAKDDLSPSRLQERHPHGRTEGLTGRQLHLGSGGPLVHTLFITL